MSPLPPEPLPPSQFLPEATFKAEMLLWRRFLDNKVLLSCGQTFECKEPGWFRLVFSDKAHRLQLGKRPPLLAAPSLCPPASRPTCGSSSLSWPVLPTEPPVPRGCPFSFPGMQRVRQVLEGKSQVAEEPSSYQTQKPRSQHR